MSKASMHVSWAADMPLQVHHFQDIGYRHNSMKHCPSYNRNNCACDALEAVEFHTPSYGRCHAQWEQSISGQPRQT